MKTAQAEIPALLQKLTVSLSEFLNRILPELEKNWWEKCVFKFLSFQQQQRVERQKVQTLSVLDLSALLRVLDNNWYLISPKLNANREDRHYIKEMPTIRNRYAHLKAEGYSSDDMYRDLDTLQRFAAVIQADDSLIQEIKNSKKSLIATVNELVSPQPLINERQEPETEYTPGQLVALQSDPTIKGAVIGVLPGDPENRYQGVYQQ